MIRTDELINDFVDQSKEILQDNLPEEYQPLIRDALREYSDGEGVDYDMDLARQYARYAVGRIKES